MRDILITALSTAISTGAIFGFIQFLVTRHDDRDDEKKKVEDALADINNKLTRNEKDTLRTQLLLLILMKPDEKHEILTVGECYFVKLKGNWYMTSLFKKWMRQNNVEEPEWFVKE